MERDSDIYLLRARRLFMSAGEKRNCITAATQGPAEMRA